MIRKICEEIYAGINLRENLIELNKLIKDDGFLDQFLDIYYEKEDFFIALLDDEEPKVRKNAIKLLGRVADPSLLEPLYNHYKGEETLFLKSDYLSALSEFDYKDYLPELKARWKALGDQEQTKHVLEEFKELKKLIWKLDPPKRHTFSGYELENKLLLIVSKGSEEAVLEQALHLPATSGKTMAGGCLLVTKSLEAVEKIRIYQAVLFDFLPSTLPAFKGREIGERILGAGMVKYLQERHEEDFPFLFRVEIKGIKDVAEKNKLAKELSRYLEENSQGNLINEPSFYEVEIRVIVGKKGSRVFLKLTCMADERFSYRKYATSTSMQPSKAALMMHYIESFLKPDANVLDPFCGTGTLLIERAKLMKSRSLYGLDISGQAVQAAWENSRRADVLLHLIQRNFDDFSHEYAFDEILTDMPRKSDNRPQKQIEYLYHLLFVRSARLLSPGGILAVYTEDEKAMEKELAGAPWAKFIQKYPMGKDQASWVYVIEKTDKHTGEIQ